MIELKHIYKSYGKREILHDISFILNKGETAAFLGTNGAGKTTTMNIMAGILSADAGEVTVDGIKMEQDTVGIKRKIGYLPENNPLYEDMYVREYLEYVARIYFAEGDIKDRVNEMIERMDLTREYKKKIHTLSHGNKQRVGLAQALIHDPEILILDEPSNGLDPVQQQKIYSLIKASSQSRAILFSSHRLDEVSDIASRYLVIKEGHLILDEMSVNINSIKEYFYSLQ